MGVEQKTNPLSNGIRIVDARLSGIQGKVREVIIPFSANGKRFFIIEPQPEREPRPRGRKRKIIPAQLDLGRIGISPTANNHPPTQKKDYKPLSKAEAIKHSIQNRLARIVLSHMATGNLRNLDTDPTNIVMSSLPEGVPPGLIFEGDGTRKPSKEKLINFLLFSIDAAVKRVLAKKPKDMSDQERQIMEFIRRIDPRIDVKIIIGILRRHYSIPTANL